MRKKLLGYGIIALLLCGAAIGFSRLRFMWHDNALHVATYKQHKNGSELVYFLEIPFWPKTKGPI